MRIRRWLCILLFGSHVAAAEPGVFRGARIIEQNEASTVVEFAFAQDIRATATSVTNDRIELRLRASPTAQWEPLDESFDGDLGAVERLTIDGSAAAGYRVAIRLGWPMTIELLPQGDAHRIALRLTKPAAPDRVAVAVAKPAPSSAPATAGDSSETANAPVAPAEPVSSDPFEQAIADGKAAAMAKEYGRAIGLFTKAAESNDVVVRQSALELLGSARERNHQDAQAKLVYQQFLKQYPDAEAASRIQQRLAGLVTRDLPVQKKLTVAQRDTVAWTAVGNVSQFYQRYETSVNDEQSVVGVDGVFTNADVIVGRRSQNVDLGLRIATNGMYDFGPDADGSYQMSTAYLEARQIDWGVDVRVGRQSQQDNGVLGRFDGVRLRYDVARWLKVGVIGGYAVDYATNAFSSERPLYGVNAEVSLADGTLEFAPFYIEQQANGLLDRRAVGMETRYFKENVSAFSLFDYDTYHKVLNTSYLMLNLRFDDGLSAYATFDHRRSPYITTENALIGQGVNSLSQLETTYDTRQIEQLADDRTATLTLGSVGFDKDLSSRLQVGADVSYSDFSQTQTSGNVSGTPEQQDFYYTLRFRSDEIFGSQTYSALYLRYADGESSQTSSVYWNNRFTFRSVWQLYPRVRVDYRDFTDSGETQWMVAPSLRLDYRPTRNMNFELEMGYDRTQRDMPVQSMDIVGYYVRLGYRSLF